MQLAPTGQSLFPVQGGGTQTPAVEPAALGWQTSPDLQSLIVVQSGKQNPPVDDWLVAVQVVPEAQLGEAGSQVGGVEQKPPSAVSHTEPAGQSLALVHCGAQKPLLGSPARSGWQT